MTVLGTDEERGILKWRKQESFEDGSSIYTTDMRTYELPFIQKYLDKISVCRYLPFCPTFRSGFHESNDIEQNVNEKQDSSSDMTNVVEDRNTKL